MPDEQRGHVCGVLAKRGQAPAPQARLRRPAADGSFGSEPERRAARPASGRSAAPAPSLSGASGRADAACVEVCHPEPGKGRCVLSVLEPWRPAVRALTVVPRPPASGASAAARAISGRTP
jgi:hypothetical protein